MAIIAHQTNHREYQNNKVGVTARASNGIKGGAPSSGIDPSTEWAISWCNKSIAACFKVDETTGAKIVEELTRNLVTLNIAEMNQNGLGNFYFLKNSNFAKLVTGSGENLFDLIQKDKIQESDKKLIKFCERIDKIILMAFANVEDTGKESFLKSIPALWLAHTAGFESRLEYELLTTPAHRTICTSEFFTNDKIKCQTFKEKTEAITMLIKQFQKESLFKTPLQRARTKLAFASALNPRLGENSVVKCDYDIIQTIFDFPYVYLNLGSVQEIDKLIKHVSKIFKNRISTTETAGQNVSDDDTDFDDDLDSDDDLDVGF